MKSFVVLTAASVAAMCLVSAGSAYAVQDLGQPDVSVSTVQADTANARVCRFDHTVPKSKVTFLSTGVAVGTAYESGGFRATGTTCPDVLQTYTVTITDSGQAGATPAPTRTVTSSSTAKLPTVSVSQSVAYSLTSRTYGSIRVTFKWKTSLSPFATCSEDFYTLTAAGNPLHTMTMNEYTCL